MFDFSWGLMVMSLAASKGVNTISRGEESVLFKQTNFFEKSSVFPFFFPTGNFPSIIGEYTQTKKKRSPEMCNPFSGAYLTYVA